VPLLIAAGGLLLGLALGAVIFFGLPSSATEPPGLASGAGAQVLGEAPVTGGAAPDFTLTDIAGAPVSLADAAGSPVLINFWATWCGPCRIEMPAIQARYEMHKDAGLRVFAVDFDEGQAEVEDFAKAFGLTFDVLLDPGGEVNNMYRVLGYPSSYFVDAEGIIRVVHVGMMTESQLDDNLAQILP
jgi:peroxiredoxin